MPSEAMIRGAEIVGNVDPDGIVPITGIRARRLDDDSAGVAITIPCHPRHGFNGEHWQTIAVPMDEGHPMFACTLERVHQLIGRWIDVQSRIDGYAAERLACDVDEDAGFEVDDDMPVIAARVHSPLILRAACDALGIDDDARMALLDEVPVRYGNLTITVDDVDHDDPRTMDPVLGPRTTVRRATITAPGVKWTQGVNMHYLDLDQVLPASIASAMIGMPVRRIIGMTGLSDAPGVVVLGHGSWKGRTRLKLSRAHGYLGGAKPAVGHDIGNEGIRS